MLMYKNIMKVTVFTPTYNRGEYLPLIYKCLCEQTCKDFEWLVVDDGSTDATSSIMQRIIQNSLHGFSIQYFFKPNGGKHTAINMGVEKSSGDIFLILDSDDELPPNAVDDVINEYKTIADDNNCGGVCGLMAHRNGKLIGSGFPIDSFEANSLDLRYKYNVIGDLIEVFKTDVLREFPFPEIHGERFCPEALIWNRIAQKYKLKCFNKVVYHRDYLDGGLTDNIVKIRMKSPIASMMCYAELSKMDIPFKQKLKAAINYWRFRFCLKGKQDIPNISWFWLVVIPIAFVMHINDLKVTKRND